MVNHASMSCDGAWGEKESVSGGASALWLRGYPLGSSPKVLDSLPNVDSLPVGILEQDDP